MNATSRPLRDISPLARLAVVNQRRDGKCILDESPQYELLVRTVRTTLFSCGRFPAWLARNNSDASGQTRPSLFMEDLIEHGISMGVSLLGKTDAEVVSGAKSIARELIHREKIERRWYETDAATGKRIRKSEAEMRVVHPVKAVRDGEEDWLSPLTLYESDAEGTSVSDGTSNPTDYNLTETRLLKRLHHAMLIQRVIVCVGPESYKFLVNYAERKRGSTPIPANDRDRFRQLKKKVRACVEGELWE